MNITRIIWILYILAFSVSAIYLMGVGYVRYSTSGKLDDIALFYVSFFYCCTLIGFIPPIYLFYKTDLWSAPPFIYNRYKYVELTLHIAPGFLWLGLSLLQVYLAGTAIDYHKLLGSMFMATVVGAFFVTAMWSAFVVKLSPLGSFVRWMETGLGMGILIYFIAGMYFIYTGNMEYHRLAMVATITAAGGPGIFRMLRSIREIVSGRILDIDNFGEYDAVVNFPVKWRNFSDVEATYFSMAFLTTDLLQFLFFYLTGNLNSFTLIYVFLPPFWIVLGKFLSGVYENMRFSFALNYDFKVSTAKFSKEEQNERKSAMDDLNIVEPAYGSWLVDKKKKE